jgi:transcriptional regulator with XRE-family HTH domain
MVGVMEQIGQTLRRLRLAAGMTQFALANAAGLSLSAITQLEQGTNNDPRTGTVRALARALGCTVDELVNAEGERE